MKKISNDTFEYGEKLYKVVENKKGQTCRNTCPLHGELDGDCAHICTEMYRQLKNPQFERADAVLVEVIPEETVIENDEIEPDYKKLYEEEHRKYEETLSRAKGLIDGMKEENVDATKEDIKNLFPGEELEEKESEDERVRKNCIHLLEQHKEHSEDKFEIEECITWLTSLKEYFEWVKKQGEQESGWSEEDEKIKEDIIYDIHRLIEDNEPSSHALASYQKEIDWLKSLKDRIKLQPQWKPSEEQMSSLYYVAIDNEKPYGTDAHNNLKLLYHELEKLK